MGVITNSGGQLEREQESQGLEARHPPYRPSDSRPDSGSEDNPTASSMDSRETIGELSTSSGEDDDSTPETKASLEKKPSRAHHVVLAIAEDQIIPQRSWSTSQESRESGFLSNHSSNDDTSLDAQASDLNVAKSNPKMRKTRKGLKSKNDPGSKLEDSSFRTSVASSLSLALNNLEAIESVPEHPDSASWDPTSSQSHSPTPSSTVSESPIEKRQSKMEMFYAREGERAACLTFCRDVITRTADKSVLHRAQIETILSDRDFCIHLFKLFDKTGRGELNQEEWIATLKQNT
eukprot:maker-scaffold287_size221780-snap-gene-0.27 protein:Tk01889 transcript:maker-scaffold287_size221780-snap-gene-0.27-mRNA-1 annotation:"---NA---"